MSAYVLSPAADILAISSPRPWRYINEPSIITGGRKDRIEDANGNDVITNVGHLDGPLICAAVNYLYDRDAEAETAVTDFINSTKEARR